LGPGPRYSELARRERSRWPYEAIRQSAALTWVSIARDANGLPTFYANCAGREFCWRFIDKAGARVELDFAFAELDNWQRLEAGLRGFADRLIVPSPGKNAAATAPNRSTAEIASWRQPRNRAVADIVGVEIMWRGLYRIARQRRAVASSKLRMLLQ
jgi:hypothetical protein